jgi:hypothetical protein
MPIDPISAGVSTLTSVASTVNQIIDASKRRDFEMALANMESTQRLALERQMANAKNQNERMSILANVLSVSQASKQQQQIAKERNQLILLGIIMATGVITLGVILYFKKKK